MNNQTHVMRERHVRIPAGTAMLEGDLVLPPDAYAVVLFAHGSGSGRHSPRNRAVASVLQDAGLGTLLLDLLTLKEEKLDEWTGRLRFDIPFLAGRVLAVTEWLEYEKTTSSKKIGYFGASTGAAAALVAAAQHPKRLGAVVSRGGRPDLAGGYLSKVIAPTLLIVGGWDHPVIEMNEQALADLDCEKKLVIVPGATHLFQEPGALEQVSGRAIASK